MTTTAIDMNSALAIGAGEHVMEIVFALRSELVLFCLAFVLHQVMFGTMPRGGKFAKNQAPDNRSSSKSPKGSSKNRTKACNICAPPGLEDEALSNSDSDSDLLVSRKAFERGDHKAVLRSWSSLRCSDSVPASVLAEVVESMQRLKKDSNAILSEIQGYCRRNRSTCNTSYINRLLESLTKSLDTVLVNGMMDCLPSLDIKPNSCTYEALIQMHFTTRSFKEIAILVEDMTNQGLAVTSRTSLMLLKVALQAGQLEEAIHRFHEVPEAPQHLWSQLVEIACRQRRMDYLMAKLDLANLPLSTETLNAVLSECVRARGLALAQRMQQVARDQDVKMNGRTYQLFIRIYADAGKPDKVCDAFDKYLESSGTGDDRRRSLLDAQIERCLITAALQCNRKDIAAMIFERAPTDTAKHISMIRSSASQGKLDEAQRIFDALEAAGADMTHSLFNTMLDACVECCDLERAQNLMQRMVSAGMADEVSYNTLIKAYLRHKSFESARSVIDQMRKAGCTPNHVTYNELINYLVRSDQTSDRLQVWDIINEMKRNRIHPNQVTCSILFRSLKARSSQADIMRAMELVDSMDEPMDEILLSSVIEACVRIGKPGLLTEKLKQLQGENGIKVSGAHTFGTLIKAYGHAHDMNGAWQCWKAMRSQRVRPTSITIGCMVEAVATNGDVDGAYELLSQLLEDDECKEQINAVVFGSVLKGFGRTGRMERVRAVFNEMLEHGIEPSVATYNAVIDSCVRNNQVDFVPALFDDLKSRGLQPSLITYSTLIKGYCQSGDMQTAFATLKDLQNTRGLKADDIVYNTMLDGCCSAGLCTEAEQLLQEMENDSLVPGNYTLTVLVRLMGQAHRLSRAFELVETLTRKYRFKTNSHVYGALVQACVTNRDLPRASDTLEQAVRSRVHVEARICLVLFRGLINAGRASKVVQLLRMLPGLSSADNDRSLLGETISLLADAGDEAAALIPALLSDVRAVWPRLRLDAVTERSVKALSAKQSSHPWRQR